MFTKATQVKRYFKVALYGKEKTGKTRFALSFPKPCVADAERGSLLYADKYNFDVKDANHWPELLGVLDWLEKGQHSYLTFIVDPLSVFYQDLIEMQVQHRRNRSGNEMLVQADWGMIKRRWKNFMNRLIDLNMHVVLVMREKDVYEDYTDSRTGEEKNRKTGDKSFEADKSTGYIFDFILRFRTEENKKAKTCRHLVECEGSRKDEIRKFSVFDITDKFGYPEIFEPIEKLITAGAEATPRDTPKETASASGAPAEEAPPVAAPTPTDPTPGDTKRTAGKGKRRTSTAPVEPQPTEPLAPPNSPTENMAELTEMFGTGVSDDQPEASAEDFKVLFTRAGQMTWPDGSPFVGEDGKIMIKVMYKVESAKELRKPQVDFLYEEFGKVLGGKAYLARDEKGIPFIATKSTTLSKF